MKGTTCAQIYADARDAAGTIGMSASSVTVAITRGATQAAATYPCAGSLATSTTQPCAGSATGDSIYVKLSYDSQLIIPPISSRTTT